MKKTIVVLLVVCAVFVSFNSVALAHGTDEESFYSATQGVGISSLWSRFVSIFLNKSSNNSDDVAAASKAITLSTKNQEVSKTPLLITQVAALGKDISSVNIQYQKAKTASGKANVSQVITQRIKQRKELVKQIMKTSPQLFNAVAMKSADRSALPADVQQDVEQKVTVKGTLTVIHVDDFTNHTNDHFEYFLNVGKTKYSFYPTSEVSALSGTTVMVTGYAVDNLLTANTGPSQNNIVKLDDGPKIDSIGEQKTLVILVKSFTSETEPFTPAEGQQLVFNGQFHNFMKQQSYGKVFFIGDVFGWVVAGQQISSCYFLDPTVLGNVVNTYKIDLSKYDRLVFLNNNAGGGCSGVGKSSLTVNGKDYLISESSIGLYAYNQPSGWGAQPFTWTNLDYVLSHELGHALGTMHSNGWSCATGEILYGECTHLEYGNFFDTMGTNGYSLDFNAYFKEQLGWIPQAQVVSITQSGSYTIHPLELADGTKLAKVYIKNSTSTPYAIEFRKAIGFDRNLNRADLLGNQNGIFVNRIQTQSPPATELLDMSPIGDWWGEGAKSSTLNLPSASSSVYSFVDAGRGITVGPVQNVSSSSISFNVNLQTPTCERKMPNINNFSGSRLVAAGASGYLNLTISNQDYFGCTSANFDFTVAPSSWQYVFSPETPITLSPGEEGYKYIGFTIPANTPPGNVMLGVDVINQTSGLKKHLDFLVQVTAPLTITSVSPTNGHIGTTVTIMGTGFDPYGGTQVGLTGYNIWTNPQWVSATENSATYFIPATVTTCDTSSCHDIPTPDGDYALTVIANSASASADFHVGDPVTPSTVSTRGGRLGITYDPAGGEDSLVATFSVRITAGSVDEKVDKNNAFDTGLNKSDGSSGWWGSEQYDQPVGTTDDGNGFYVIPANKSVTFNVRHVANPKAMFGGQYIATLRQVRLGDYLRMKYIPVPPPNTTNLVIIIGEVSPYINSVNPNPVPFNVPVTIEGIRFADTGNAVTLTNKTESFTRIADSTNNGTRIQVVPNVAPGSYYLQVNVPKTGMSNGIGLTVASSTKPIIYSFSPTSGPAGTVVTVTGSNFGSTNIVQFNGNILDVPSDGSTLQFKVPANTPVDTYGLSVINSADTSTGQNSNTVIFAVTETPPPPARSITALTPESDVMWIYGQSYPITWSSTSALPTDTVKVWLKNAAGSYYHIIGPGDAVLPNTGSATITIPDDGTIPSGTYNIEYRFGPAVKSTAPGMVTIGYPTR